MTHEKLILNQQDIERALTRIAHEIIERNKTTDHLAIIGIRTGGTLLAKLLHQKIEDISQHKIPLGFLDITLYRDDLSEVGPQPNVKETKIDFDVTNKVIVLIDDVLFTGRTVRCGLDAVIDYGRPKCIQLVALVDRGHRELPIKADYVGKNIPTSLDDEVRVVFNEQGTADKVIVVTRKRE